MGSVCLLRIWGIYLFVLFFPAQNQIVTFLFSLYQILYQKKKKKEGKIFLFGEGTVAEKENYSLGKKVKKKKNK